MVLENVRHKLICVPSQKMAKSYVPSFHDQKSLDHSKNNILKYFHHIWSWLLNFFASIQKSHKKLPLIGQAVSEKSIRKKCNDCNVQQATSKYANEHTIFIASFDMCNLCH